MLTFSVSRALGYAFLFAALGVCGSCEQAEAPGRATTLLACDALFATATTDVTPESFDGGPGPVLKAQTSYVVTLVPTVVPGQWSGHGQWTIDTPGMYGIYVTPGVTFVVRDAGGAMVPFTARLGSPAACEKIDRYAFLELQAGTYSLELGPIPVVSVKLLLIPAVAQDKF